MAYVEKRKGNKAKDNEAYKWKDAEAKKIGYVKRYLWIFDKAADDACTGKGYERQQGRWDQCNGPAIFTIYRFHLLQRFYDRWLYKTDEPVNKDYINQ